MNQLIPSSIIIFLFLITGCKKTGTRQNTVPEEMPPMELKEVKLNGELGRRMDITIHNNLLKLKTNEDFLLPFQEKKHTGGYIGIGKLIDASVRFAQSENLNKNEEIFPSLSPFL